MEKLTETLSHPLHRQKTAESDGGKVTHSTSNDEPNKLEKLVKTFSHNIGRRLSMSSTNSSEDHQALPRSEGEDTSAGRADKPQPKSEDIHLPQEHPDAKDTGAHPSKECQREPGYYEGVGGRRGEPGYVEGQGGIVSGDGPGYFCGEGKIDTKGDGVGSGPGYLGGVGGHHYQQCT